MEVQHRLEYRTTNQEGAEIVLEPTTDPVKCVIFYPALVKVVELYQEGRMHQGDASALSKGGWAYKIRAEDRIRAIAEAVVETAEQAKVAVKRLSRRRAVLQLGVCTGILP